MKQRSRYDDRGMVATELAILFPVMLAMAMLVIFAGRVSEQNATVQSAADAAARTASIQLDQPTATTAAQTAATSNANLCSQISVDRLTWREAAPDQPGLVTVEVSCTISNAHLGFSFGERTITRTAVSVVEYWRPAS